MKKWLIPLAYPPIFVALFLLIGLVADLGNGDGTGYGGVVIILCGIIFYCIAMIPAICIIYSRRCLSGQRSRFLFTLYHSFFMALPYLVLFFSGKESIAYGAVLFVWCEIWALLGLVNLRRKKS